MRRTRIASGFSLVELLVVMSIMSILLGMVYIGQRRPSDAMLVDLAAKELEATLFEARALAMRTNTPHAVVFHIDNHGDGRVMWNKKKGSGEQPGHWYQIVGPQERGNAFQGYLPYPPNHRDDPDQKNFKRLVQKHMMGERHYLPEGTRFLALGDLDFGTEAHWQFRRRASDWFKIMDEYPRPWFGVLKPRDECKPTPPGGAAFQLYPWGGYDMVWEVAHRYRWGAMRTFNGQNSNYPATGFNMRAGVDGNGKPVTWVDDRPLVEGALMDIVIIFSGDGNAQMDRQFWGSRDVASRTLGGDHPDASSPGGVGSVIDKPVGMRYGATGNQHDVLLTGGYHITICRDIDPDEPIYPVKDRYDLFNSEADAIKSISPFKRVFVHQRTGEVSLRDKTHPMCQMRMNQRNISIDDMGMKSWWRSNDNPAMFRAAHRHLGYTDSFPASIHGGDPDWNDSEEGWRGWYPPY